MYSNNFIFVVFFFGCVKEWIMEHWENNYYISAIAGANNGSSLVVMSKGQSKLFECLVL